MSTHDQLQALIAAGESETVEFKKSTAQLTRVGETLCAFLNGQGGRVLIGVTPSGELIGQQVADKTQREIATMLERMEPPPPVKTQILPLPGRATQLIVLAVSGEADARPFTFGGRPFQRIGTTTSVMPQERYETLLLDRAHARRRWENQPAVNISISDLDAEEILRTRESAIAQRRISAGTSRDLGDILDRLGLRRNGVLTQAAQVLYGTRFLPDYPQGLVKLGHFRGTTVTGDILDNRQEHLHAFAIVREAMAFLDRTLPLAAHFPDGEMFRKDRLPVPPNAMRELLLNAVMHRNYADPGSYVAVAVFDDRIEVRSVGALPAGVTGESLSGAHRSVLRNPLIAEAFHRTGAVEIWGRGTNRVIEECEKYGIDPPIFEERQGALIVTLRAPISPAPQVTPQVTPQVRAVLQAATQFRRRSELQDAAGLKDREHFRRTYLEPLLAAGWLEMEIPEKPRSSKQRYRTTAAGRRAIATGDEV